MQNTEIEPTYRDRCVGRLEGGDIFIPVLPQKFGENCLPFELAASFHTQHEIRGGSGCSAVAIYKGVDVVQPPKHKARQGNRVCLSPLQIDHIDEIVHLRLDTIMSRRLIVADVHRTRPEFAGVRMQTSDAMEVQGLLGVPSEITHPEQKAPGPFQGQGDKK